MRKDSQGAGMHTDTVDRDHAFHLFRILTLYSNLHPPTRRCQSLLDKSVVVG